MMQVINEKELSNFRFNRVGGVDADWSIDGVLYPYTLTNDEVEEVEASISPFDSEGYLGDVQVSDFRAQRQRLLDNAIVTTSLGNQYDADEQSISRMANAILAAQRRGVVDIKWSLADTPTGVMTDVTLEDLEEAHELAVENMASIWSIE